MRYYLKCWGFSYYGENDNAKLYTACKQALGNPQSRMTEIKQKEVWPRTFLPFRSWPRSFFLFHWFCFNGCFGGTFFGSHCCCFFLSCLFIYFGSMDPKRPIEPKCPAIINLHDDKHSGLIIQKYPHFRAHSKPKLQTDFLPFSRRHGTLEVTLYRITELLRLEKTFKIIMSNHNLTILL